jgi:uncharacterized membrane protein YvlD (DUF360 family)
MRFLAQLMLKALAFLFLLPMVPGIHMHGNFVVAIGLAILFGIMQWVVEVIAMALTAWLTVSTLGMGLLILVPMWILGFWLLPAVALKLVADLIPQHLIVAGWVPAILGSLILFVTNIVTSSITDVRKTIR